MATRQPTFNNLNMPKMMRNAYSVKKKMAVVSLTATMSLTGLSQLTGIPISCICRWKRNKEYLQSLLPSFSNQKKIGCGRKTTLTFAQETRIKAEVDSRRARLLPVSMTDVVLIAKIMYPEMNDVLHYSSGWATGFCKRVSLSWRRVTSFTTRAAANEESNAERQLILNQYMQDTRTAMLQGDVELVNMDETPVYLDMPSHYTLTSKGQKHVKAVTHGLEKKRVTVVLACTSKGDKLPPMVLTNRKTLRGIVVPAGLTVETGVKSSFMNQGIMMKWIDGHKSRLQGANRRLLLDSFSAHKSQLVKSYLDQSGILYTFVPPGTTSTLQPLDVGIMKPFKDGLRKQWKLHMSQPNAAKTGLQLILDWISKSWCEVSADTCRAAFRKAIL